MGSKRGFLKVSMEFITGAFISTGKMNSKYRIYRSQKTISGDKLAMSEVQLDLEKQVEAIMREVPVLREGGGPTRHFPVDHSYWQRDPNGQDDECERGILMQRSYSFVPSTHADTSLRGGKLTVQYVYDVGKGEHLVLATLNIPHEKEKKREILEQVLRIYDTFFKQE